MRTNFDMGARYSTLCILKAWSVHKGRYIVAITCISYTTDKRVREVLEEQAFKVRDLGSYGASICPGIASQGKI